MSLGSSWVWFFDQFRFANQVSIDPGPTYGSGLVFIVLIWFLNLSGFALNFKIVVLDNFEPKFIVFGSLDFQFGLDSILQFEWCFLSKFQIELTYDHPYIYKSSWIEWVNIHIKIITLNFFKKKMIITSHKNNFKESLWLVTFPYLFVGKFAERRKWRPGAAGSYTGPLFSLCIIVSSYTGSTEEQHH